jgi:hypothetical protein
LDLPSKSKYFFASSGIWTPKVHRGEFETTGVIYFGYNMIYYGSSPQTILDDIGELWTCGAGSKWSDAYPEVDI